MPEVPFLWDLTKSASAHATTSVTLAGFAIAVLAINLVPFRFGRPQEVDDRQVAAHGKTMRLVALAFAILVVAAVEWGAVAGLPDVASVGPDCPRGGSCWEAASGIWMAGAAATDLLAVGAIALLGALVDMMLHSTLGEGSVANSLDRLFAGVAALGAYETSWFTYQALGRFKGAGADYGVAQTRSVVIGVTVGVVVLVLRRFQEIGVSLTAYRNSGRPGAKPRTRGAYLRKADSMDSTSTLRSRIWTSHAGAWSWVRRGSVIQKVIYWPPIHHVFGQFSSSRLLGASAVAAVVAFSLTPTGAPDELTLVEPDGWMTAAAIATGSAGVLAVIGMTALGMVLGRNAKDVV